MNHFNCKTGYITGCETCTEKRVRESIAEAVRSRGRALRGLAAWKCDAFQALADDIESGECRAEEEWDPPAPPNRSDSGQRIEKKSK